MSASNRLSREFYIRDVLVVAPALVGKVLVLRYPENAPERYVITEVEAYRGTEDKACHASKGRTRRTEMMYREGGRLYVYFVYGMYWMLNIVTGLENEPQAALIRGIEGFNGPGKLTRELKIDGAFYGEDLAVSSRIWIEDNGRTYTFKTGPRVGIDYAGKPWTDKPWRFYISSRLNV
jgi:DNA-3-methyladenine glycosylase